jgi:hypothetical protein
MILYHYTNQEGYEGIRETRVIQPSIERPVDALTRIPDALAGNGIYLTRVPPSTINSLNRSTVDELTKKLFGFVNEEFANRTKYYFALDMSGIEKVESLDPFFDLQGEIRMGLFLCRRDGALEIDDILLDHGGPLWS